MAVTTMLGAGQCYRGLARSPLQKQSFIKLRTSVPAIKCSTFDNGPWDDAGKSVRSGSLVQSWRRTSRTGHGCADPLGGGGGLLRLPLENGSENSAKIALGVYDSWRKKAMHLHLNLPENGLNEDAIRQGSQFHTDAVALCRQLVSSWDGVHPEKVEMSLISGGITNMLVKMTPTSGHRPVVLRVFGDNTEKFIDRAAETKNLKAITENSFGAKVLGVFANGRIEEFLQGRALEPNEMYKFFNVIAPKIREFHEMDPPMAVQNGHGMRPQLFHSLREFQSKAAQVRFEESEKAELLSELRVNEMRTEIDELEILVRKNAPKAKVVICHNDLLSGNFMIHEDGDGTTNLHLIDFEYAAPSYAAYDIGNHFYEMAGFECNWEDFPTIEQQKSWLRLYLGGGCTDADVEKWRKDVELLGLASNLYWAMWAILQESLSSIDFDFLGYAKKRLDKYATEKRNIIKACTQVALSSSV